MTLVDALMASCRNEAIADLGPTSTYRLRIKQDPPFPNVHNNYSTTNNYAASLEDKDSKRKRAHLFCPDFESLRNHLSVLGVEIDFSELCWEPFEYIGLDGVRR